MGRSVARRPPARQWQECHCAIDFRHASRGRPGPARACVAFDLSTPAQVFGNEPGRYALHGVRVARRARADDDGLRARRRRAASTRSPRPTPCSSPGCARRGGRRRAAVLDALRAAHARGARVASICTGAFVLAHAGLLDGRRATTHWAHAEQLAERYPAVTVDPGVLYVDEGDVLDLGRRRRGHRPLPAPRAPRPRRRGGQRRRAADRRGAAPRRRPGAVRRARRCPPRRERRPRGPRAPGRSSACASRSRCAAMARHAALQRAHASPGASAPRRAPRRCSGCCGQRVAARPAPAGGHRPPGRGRRRRTPASAPPPRCARISAAPRPRHRSRIAAASGVVRRNGYHPQRGAGHPRRRQHRRPREDHRAAHQGATGWRSRR